MRLGDRLRGWQWRRREGSRRVADACHCGRTPYSRGMCFDCAEVRCDAYPEDCPHRFTFPLTGA